MIPITIITGFLGSGKTSTSLCALFSHNCLQCNANTQTALILNLIPQLPRTYKLALLKNEYGDVKVDTALAFQCHKPTGLELLLPL